MSNKTSKIGYVLRMITRTAKIDNEQTHLHREERMESKKHILILARRRVGICARTPISCYVYGVI